MKSKYKIMSILGTVLTVFAVVQTATASWTILHGEDVPEDMK
ncbi:cyclic lactone autoinducer peptide [Paenibacillus sophorae]|uniref:Cyclic lactone autoinducer peptide n=1 Tax=Paenibacillus sophorae TaxID=1333845 RepID=A0A1H8GTH2_9BACL|nr:cyclic lactone autoinducer peptide [Paenibacillus sophorae]QWU14339.1 cyclic lactone autoinducer peptide [Paenibacillus sophorae]SEN47342.1 cyclic lactone autoinducer peptide [Paenibacillus sophorae]